MAKCNDINRALEAVLPRRKALQVALAIEDCGPVCTCDLRGFRIPAHFATDLSRTSEKALRGLDAILSSHGAALAR